MRLGAGRKQQEIRVAEKVRAEDSFEKYQSILGLV